MPESVEQPPPLLEVRDLKVYYPIHGGLMRRVVDQVKAVDGVSFAVPKGTTVGLVGESGSGKTTIGRSIIKLAPMTSGQIFYADSPPLAESDLPPSEPKQTYYDNTLGDASSSAPPGMKDIGAMTRPAFFPYRKKIQMVFQDPFNSLNPRMTIEQIISEPLDIHFPAWDKAKKSARILDLLGKVNLPADSRSRYPHEFSGGQRQRIGIARALAVEPEFIICDEPVSALDVSVQAQIVNLLQDLQEELGLTYLFIAHDLAVVEHISDFVLVMNQGKLVEQATSEEIYSNPQDPYTKKLLAAVPSL
ncbi:ABC transporter ATP-binding protein [Cerasicoccus arenae]|uniref:Peptide ABC transporter ATP-binding protein n=1 Tax=Cerasicoccus arenae TaxID=424488 RepID=A0A8J3GFD4_9BACT|nr:ATP-binding cassette domain-containing protein [Cerasicoccus arenae]MBK1859385.1 ABC transporter ATP-binding protein [Cerasicoccus arenae]GHC10672.1 peptide ABC transporter ATP-binding protein [Cerasicoccus arenae]